MTNREGNWHTARKMGYEIAVINGVFRIFQSLGLPSFDRRITLAMQDQGWDDNDLAEAFGVTPYYISQVRRDKEEIRAKERIPEHLEWYDPDCRPEDPSPEEILVLAAQLREVRDDDSRLPRPPGSSFTPGQGVRVRCYSWRGDQRAFIPTGIDGWAEC